MLTSEPVLIVVCLQEIHQKYSPSSRLVFYGCAATSSEDRCGSSITAGFDFEWGQVYDDGGLMKRTESEGTMASSLDGLE